MTISRLIFMGSISTRSTRLMTLVLAGSIGSVGASSAQAWQQKLAMPSLPQAQTQPSSVSKQVAEDARQTVRQPGIGPLPKNRLDNQTPKNLQKTALGTSAKNPLPKHLSIDAEQARDQHYRANQQDVLDRYKNAAAPRVAPPLPQSTNLPLTLGQ